jgi:hypothetical protein
MLEASSAGNHATTLWPTQLQTVRLKYDGEMEVEVTAAVLRKQKGERRPAAAA